MFNIFLEDFSLCDLFLLISMCHHNSMDEYSLRYAHKQPVKFLLQASSICYYMFSSSSLNHKRLLWYTLRLNPITRRMVIANSLHIYNIFISVNVNQVSKLITNFALT
jgi:hypothetical protein